jgi:hypothetical protein
MSLVTSVEIPISWPSCVSPGGGLSDPGSSIELSAEFVGTGREDLVCFSTVRWSASARRARLVLARAAIHRRVFYIEPPRWDTERSYIEAKHDASGVRIAIPHIPRGAKSQEPWNLVRSLLRAKRVRRFVSCYYAASQLSFSAFLTECHSTTRLISAEPHTRLRDPRLSPSQFLVTASD